MKVRLARVFTIYAAACLLHVAVDSTLALAQADAMDLRQAAVFNAPADIATWPVTAAITRLEMRAPEGLSFEFSAADRWPEVIPPGWTGALQYTVWAVVNVNGRWATSGVIQMWKGRPSTGAPILSDFAKNWVYDARWGTLAGYQPRVGEQMGFFLSAGDARGQTGVSSVRERTNVILVQLPANDVGVFTFLQSGHPDRAATVAAVKSQLQAAGADLAGPCGAFAITKRVAWLLRGEGAGVLSKPAGNNCEGFATDIVMYPDGKGYDVLSDAGGANGPLWGDAGVDDPTRYRPAFDPGDAPSSPAPIPSPVPSALNLQPVLDAIAALQRTVDALNQAVAAVAAKPDPVVTLPPIELPAPPCFRGKLSYLGTVTLCPVK